MCGTFVLTAVTTQKKEAGPLPCLLIGSGLWYESNKRYTIESVIPHFLWTATARYVSIVTEDAYRRLAMEVHERRGVGVAPYHVHRPCHRRGIRAVGVGAGR